MNIRYAPCIVMRAYRQRQCGILPQMLYMKGDCPDRKNHWRPGYVVTVVLLRAWRMGWYYPRNNLYAGFLVSSQ